MGAISIRVVPMLKTWSFWKTFLIFYIILVAGIWGFVAISTYFAGDYLRQLLGANGWVFSYVPPLLIAIVASRLTYAKNNILQRWMCNDYLPAQIPGWQEA
jgi:hypothetical protein